MLCCYVLAVVLESGDEAKGPSEARTAGADAASVMSQTKHNKILRTKNQGLSRPADSCKNGVPTLANYFTSEERKATPQCVAQWAGRGSENICDGLCYCLAR